MSISLLQKTRNSLQAWKIEIGGRLCKYGDTLNGEAFSNRRRVGHIGETRIAKWLRRRGNVILASFETEIESGKGMLLFGSRELIAPDILCFGTSGIFWVECKEKIAVSWYRNTKRWQTGINIEYWDDYRQVSAETKLPVWIFFLHLISEPRPEDLESDPDCPRECPTGLYAGRLETLERTGRKSKISGMIYWDVDSLRKLAEVSEL